MTKRHTRFLSQVVTIIMVLAISAMQVVPVLADDEAPPPPPTTEVVDPAAGGEVPPLQEDPSPETPPADTAADASATDVEEVPAEAAPAATEIPAEVVPAAGEAVPAETEEVPAATEQAPAATDEPAAEPETPAEILAQVPAGTDLVVLDENGEALPLVTEEAAEIITGGDPQWCPVGVAPGGAGCSPSGNTSFQTLINWLIANDPNKAGVIWIEDDYDSSTAVGDGGITNFTLNGADFTHLDNFALTIKGGWTGSGTAIDTSNPSVFSGDSLNIFGWNGAITLSDIVINDVAGGQALAVISTKAINLTRVEVGTAADPNTGNGASVQNVGGTGNITITDSKFAYSTGAGLTVVSSGAIALSKVSVDHNGSGASLNNAPGTGNVTVTNSQFSHNTGGTGLSVLSKGIITLNTVSASFNSAGGASLNNQPSETAKGVVLTSGILEFSENGGTGLTILSDGAVSLKDITATGNGADGASVNNQSGTAAITLTGTNIFSENAMNGVTLLSRRAITASNLITNANMGGYGATISNTAAGTSVNVGVTLTGNSQFNFNGGGLYITTLGAITLNNLSATGNASNYGALLQNSGSPFNSAVKLTGTNLFNDNYNTGLSITSRGAVTLNNVTANSNGAIANSGQGAVINNASTPAAQAVTLTGVNTFNDNYGGGLEIQSRGAITLNKITAENNEHGGGVLLDNSVIPATPQNVTVNGYINASGNNGNGLWINSYGLITLNNVTANNNTGGYGAILDNQTAIVAKTVALNGVNSFSQNSAGGLWIDSTGAVTLNKVTASNNTGWGVSVDNTSLSNSSPQNVTVLGYGTFNGNGSTGLQISSYGTLALANLTTSSNSGSGAVLDNYLGNAITPKAVTLTGNNTFSSNTSNGLFISSLGAITINNVVADGNGVYGVALGNSAPSALAGITVNNTSTFSASVSYNGGYGIYATSNGAILIKDLNVIGNGISGGVLNNTTGAASNVTVGTSRLNWCNHFASNNDSGLEILSNGIVTLSNLCNDGNGDSTDPSPYGYGLLVNNISATTAKAVTLLGTNTFNNNYTGGLNISSGGAVTLNKVTASDNRNGFGASIINPKDPLAPQNVTLNGYGNFSGNSAFGLQIVTYGTVTLNNLQSNDNGTSGSQVVNGMGSLPRNVTINGYVESSNNGLAGLVIGSLGVIKVANLNASGNSGTGATLQNSPGNAAVTITGHAWTNDNTGAGLSVTSKGSISIANLSAWHNGGTGAALSNNFVGSTGTVTLTGSASATGNTGSGIVIYSNRAITISNLTSQGNSGTGALLNNSFSTNASPQNVTILGYGKLSGNGDDGLDVDTYGVITLNNITANDNGWGGGGYGAVLDNFQTNGTTPKAVFLNGTNTFNNNTSVGLSVDTLGAITASNLTANGNAGTGVYLDNCQLLGACRGTGNITLTGANTFSGNGSDGLYIYSKGVVNLTKITANDNGDEGLTVMTRNNITLTCGSMTGNAGSGWLLSASGSPNLVTLKGVFSYGNGVNTTELLGTFVYVRACPLP